MFSRSFDDANCTEDERQEWTGAPTMLGRLIRAKPQAKRGHASLRFLVQFEKNCVQFAVSDLGFKTK